MVPNMDTLWMRQKQGWVEVQGMVGSGLVEWNDGGWVGGKIPIGGEIINL